MVKRVTEEQVARMRSLRDSGMSLRAIADEVGLSFGTVRRRLMTPEQYARDRARLNEYKREAYRRRHPRPHAPTTQAPPDFDPSSKVLLTDEDREKLRLIHAALRMGATPELIDRRMHWRPGETERQLVGERMAYETRAVRV